MKILIYLMVVSLTCFSWDKVTNEEVKAVDYQQAIKANTDYIKYSLFPFDDTFTHDSIYGLINNMKLSVDDITAVNTFVYDGYITDDQNRTNLGYYRNFYSGLMISSGVSSEQTRSANEFSFSLPTFQNMDLKYQQFIKVFSKFNYNSWTFNSSGENSTADNFLQYPDQFSIIEPIAESLNTETTDFQPETLKNVEGMGKINAINTRVDFGLTQLCENPLYNELDGDSVFGDENDGYTTFTLDLSCIGTLWERLKQIVPNNPSATTTRNGGVQTNPFQDWVFVIRLYPKEGDYLYPFFTWWRSSNPLPTMMRNCLKALVLLVTFYFCFRYTKELWAK